MEPQQNAEDLAEIRTILRLAAKLLTLIAESKLTSRLSPNDIHELKTVAQNAIPALLKTKIKVAQFGSKSIRVKPQEACVLLDCSYTHLSRDLAGVFTVQYPDGRGRGKPVYYLRDEVELYATTGDKAKVEAFRRKNKRPS